MIRGVNQTMVNRYISGGGGNCRCIGGNGISGGKIEMEFTVYNVEETTEGSSGTTTKKYIKKEDAERISNEILSVDLEKYKFNNAVIRIKTIFEINTAVDTYSGDCAVHHGDYREYQEQPYEQITIHINNMGNYKDYITNIFVYPNGVVFDISTFFGAKVDDSKTDNPERTSSYKLTLYYTER